jgi:hypothetical protein
MRRFYLAMESKCMDLAASTTVVERVDLFLRNQKISHAFVALVYVWIVSNECCLKPSKRPPSLKSTLCDVEIVAPSIRDVFTQMTSRVDGAS